MEHEVSVYEPPLDTRRHEELLQEHMLRAAANEAFAKRGVDEVKQRLARVTSNPFFEKNQTPSTAVPAAAAVLPNPVQTHSSSSSSSSTAAELLQQTQQLLSATQERSPRASSAAEVEEYDDGLGGETDEDEEDVVTLTVPDGMSGGDILLMLVHTQRVVDCDARKISDRSLVITESWTTARSLKCRSLPV